MDHTQTTRPSDRPMMRLAGVDDEEYDALADLFLGDGDLAPPIEAHPGTKTGTAHAPSPAPVIDELAPDPEATLGIDPAAALPDIELLMLGHLPVRAALWVRQYACSVATRCDERVALVRVVGGTVSIDLINAPEAPVDRHTRGAGPMTLRAALGAACENADRVILRVDETTEPEIIGRDEIDALTILTGADEAAIVSSYRLIKSVTGSWEDGGEIGTPRLRLAVMGASGERAAQASDKLTRAVDAFLDRPIEIIDAAGRIDATATQNLYQEDAGGESAAGAIIDTIVEIGCGLLEATATEPRPIAPPAPTGAWEHAEPQVEDTEHSERLEQLRSPEPAPRSVSRRGEDLCALLDGIDRLVTRCPHAPGVELGVDAAGRLHLVADDTVTNGVSKSGADACARLESARAWVRDHLDLIIRAEPRVAIPDAQRHGEPAAAHLLAADPPRWRGLIDSDIALYAVGVARLGGRVARVATRVN